ncbi:MAG: hypothetical protein EBV83_00830, partial [Verrucomicrobia bacterium]|nr:hypothetical protein [Verrucomicrobiota bacterium]
MTIPITAVQSPHLLSGRAFPDRNRPALYKHLNRLLHLRQGQVILAGGIHHVEVLFKNIAVDLTSRPIGG